jgi:hypothetical protein
MQHVLPVSAHTCFCQCFLCSKLPLYQTWCPNAGYSDCQNTKLLPLLTLITARLWFDNCKRVCVVVYQQPACFPHDVSVAEPR